VTNIFYTFNDKFISSYIYEDDEEEMKFLYFITFQMNQANQKKNA